MSMMTYCLSALGPPPGCGHKPTPDMPICAVCRMSLDSFTETERDNALRRARKLLQSYGYRVSSAPTAGQE